MAVHSVNTTNIYDLEDQLSSFRVFKKCSQRYHQNLHKEKKKYFKAALNLSLQAHSFRLADDFLMLKLLPILCIYAE